MNLKKQTKDNSWNLLRGRFHQQTKQKKQEKQNKNLRTNCDDVRWSLAIHQLQLFSSVWAEELFSSVKVLCPGPCDAGTFRRWMLHEVTADLPAPWIWGPTGAIWSNWSNLIIWWSWTFGYILCFGHTNASSKIKSYQEQQSKHWKLHSYNCMQLKWTSWVLWERINMDKRRQNPQIKCN